MDFLENNYRRNIGTTNTQPHMNLNYHGSEALLVSEHGRMLIFQTAIKQSLV